MHPLRVLSPVALDDRAAIAFSVRQGHTYGNNVGRSIPLSGRTHVLLSAFGRR
jgi:hypothetical protein